MAGLQEFMRDNFNDSMLNDNLASLVEEINSAYHHVPTKNTSVEDCTWETFNHRVISIPLLITLIPKVGLSDVSMMPILIS